MRARWRPGVVAYPREGSAAAAGSSAPTGGGAGGEATGTPRYWTRAAPMRRAFDSDVLRGPRCAGRMRVLATIDDPAVMARIFDHLGLPGTREGPGPGPPVSAPTAER